MKKPSPPKVASGKVTMAVVDFGIEAYVLPIEAALLLTKIISSAQAVNMDYRKSKGRPVYVRREAPRPMLMVIDATQVCDPAPDVAEEAPQ